MYSMLEFSKKLRRKILRHLDTNKGINFRIIFLFAKRQILSMFIFANRAIMYVFCKPIKSINNVYYNLKIWVYSCFVIPKLNMDMGPHRTLEDMVDYLEKYNTKFYNKQNVDFLLSIWKYSIAERNKISLFNNPNDKGIYILHLCVWGDEYAKKLLAFLAPSLLAPGNIPAVANHHNVHFHIHCDLPTKNILESTPVMTSLEQYSTIKYEVLPDKLFDSLKSANQCKYTRVLSKLSNIYPNWKYYLLGCLQNIAMLNAQQNKAYISFFMPDLMFSDNAISKLFDAIKDGKKAAVATAFRSLDCKVEDFVKPFYKNNVLSIPALELTNIAVNSMHEAAKYRIVSNKNARFQLTAQMIFNYPQEIVIRCLHYHPVLVNFNAIQTVVKFDHYPIDTHLLCNIVDYKIDLEKQVWVNENSCEIAIMEISKEHVEPVPPKFKKNIVSSIHKLIGADIWTPLNIYLVSKRCIYKYNGSFKYYVSELNDKLIIPIEHKTL